MGTIIHDAIIATVYVNLDGTLAPAIAEFREAMPAEWRHLLVGPVQSVVNGHPTYMFAPDGSKESWEDSDVGDHLREAFLTVLREPRDAYVDVVVLRFGGDMRAEGREQPHAEFISIKPADDTES